MTEKSSAAADWAAARGEKWRVQLSGMESMLAPVNDPLIRALQLAAPARIADIGCGGGGTTLEILRRAPAGSVVHGFDISAALIAVARGRIPEDRPAIAFETADMATARRETPYDRLVSRFGVMFFDDPDAAFANLARWLAPGGRFAFAVWGRLSANPWMTTVYDVVTEIVEVPPLAPGAPGPFRYAEADDLVALLKRSGFDGLAWSEWRGSLPIGGGLPAGEAARFALAALSSFGELLTKAGDAALNQARQSLTARFSPHQQQDTVRLDASVNIVTGTHRP